MNRLQRDIKYNRLLREFGRYINMYCTLHTDTPGDAEELAVKVMEAVLGSIEGMHATSRRQKKRWLHSVMRSTLHRYRQRSGMTSLDEALAAGAIVEPAVAGNDAAETLDDLLALVSPDEEALLRRLVAGYTRHELADELGVSYAALNQRIHRIIVKIRNRYKG